ncbi:MAG: EF-P beta-lysylation protein EpmB [Francisellaceae bacterium]
MIQQNDDIKQPVISRDWKKSLKQAFCNWGQLADFLELDVDAVAINPATKFPLRVPMSFASRMVKSNINDPLLRQILPLAQERETVDSFIDDPLSEERFSKTTGLLHKYYNRVLLISHPACAVHCRYCFRREFDYAAHTQSRSDWQGAFDYIAAHSEVEEVILSGGDPLMHDDNMLAWFIAKLEKLKPVKTLRFHSRIPVVLPERITEPLLTLLKNSRFNIVLVIHMNHANEMDNEVIAVLKALSEAGVKLLNQSTLLKGINDDAWVLKDLSEVLFFNGVMPYYLHVLDHVKGAAHFAIADSEAKAIHTELKAISAGYLVPKLVREIADESAKTWMG